ncbi:unnamed protein product [Oppiella nova]|uniref:Protein kinase domain-containing protein n=1 Tax=Oppiella nova TaxID=334625 RepID=A0A7R9QTC6_9ACAR|nr:unnamed protein product [Oppiella nova]CAG2173643.1 unnamed protein product [Oppiella nova]
MEQWSDYKVYYIQMELCSHSMQNILQHKPQRSKRDLKPDNILVAKTVRNGRYLKVADFGLATLHFIASGNHTTGVGTLKYMAPEFPD